MIAALFVDPRGVYAGLHDVELWDEARDARLYAGPWPVVAHPPCSRWCRLAGLVEARWGHRRGEDGGCFESALRSVRAFGGVLEHPAYSDAWAHFGLARPQRRGGWQRGIDGGWTCQVEQGLYGHPARKATWLYAHGSDEPPELRWGLLAKSELSATCSWGHYEDARIGDFPTNGNTNWADRRRLSPKEASMTPIEFRDALISIARSCTATGKTASVWRAMG